MYTYILHNLVVMYLLIIFWKLSRIFGSSGKKIDWSFSKKIIFFIYLPFLMRLVENIQTV